MLVLASGAASRAAEESEDLPIAIRDCYAIGSSDQCALEQGAHWFFVHGYQHLSLRKDASPSLVVRVAEEDHSASVFPLGSPAIPQPVEQRARRTGARAPCHAVAANYDFSDPPCPYPEIIFELAVYQVLPLGLLRIEHGRYQVQQPPLEEDEVRRLAPQIRYGVPMGGELEHLIAAYRQGTLAPVLGPFVRKGPLVYVGLLGGFTEEEGSLGGLAVFDLSGAKWTVHRPRELVEVFVTDMLLRDDKLWMGTVHYAEGGLIGISGLVEFDLASGEFHSHSVNGTTPGVVWMVRGNSRATTHKEQGALLQCLWLGTDRGLGFFDPRSGDLESWVWEAAPAGSAVPYQLRHVPKTP